MTVLHVLIYLSLLIFAAAVIARIVRIASMPIHLRWELYPVPHEKGRAGYGGSILEETDWWTKPRKKDTIGELKVMIPEILLLKGVWEHNRPLWLASWTLHFGLYLLIGEAVLLFCAGILALAGVTGSLFRLIVNVAVISAWAGCILGLIGSVLMLLRRLSDGKLKMFNTVGTYFNLLILGGVFLTGLLWIASDPAYPDAAVSFIAGLLSLSSLPALSGAAYGHLAFVLFFLVYFPFTHMTHAFVKYFTYHDIRWEDEPNLPDGKLKEKVAEAVNQPVSWAAPHVGADGKKTWVDIVSQPVGDKEEQDL